MVLNKLASQQSVQADDASPANGLDPHLVEFSQKCDPRSPTASAHPYHRVGLSMRGGGNLPKVMKLLHTLPEWKRYLALTSPERWHPFSCFKITKIFMSNMRSDQAQFYLQYVLLPAVRENIASDAKGKLNVHYYESLIRALRKPASFFKGVLFPMLDVRRLFLLDCVAYLVLQEGCTLHEAVIVASVMSKKSIPSVHFGAAPLRISSTAYSGICPSTLSDLSSHREGPRALFLRVLVDKKKDLPYKVLDELVFGFVRDAKWAKQSHTSLPVLWQQSLLAFAQRYR